MTAREIADLFFQLELVLIASLKRNLTRHKDWEKEEGFDWEAWQSAKLRDIRRFQNENRKEVAKYAPIIDQETRQLIEDQYQEGSADGFFGMNDRRVNALLDEMQTAQQQVEKAALRYMDDVYRKTVHTAALGMATGSMTLEQATDAATKEFLAAGINCVQYRNGRRVNIASYAEMALRTAATRATLMGEAKQRESMDIDTVLVSQYGACSETCLPWQGLVYIDDVWQDYNGPHTPGGTYGISRNGHQYPLLSVAVKNGLFHPNCRHTLTTWFEGISTRPKPMDKAQIERTSKLEKQQRAMERDVRALKRLAAGTQDADQAAAYRKEVRAAQKKLKAFVDENGDALRRDYWRERYDGVPLQKERSWAAETKRNQSGKVQKLNFAQETTKEDQMNIEQELSLLPQDIREKAETMISEIRVEKGIGGNGYNPKTQEILLSDERESGAVIHEYGHALERALDLRHDPAFIAVRKEGLALEDSAQTVYDRDTFTKPIWRIKSDKFISVYQGRIYPHPKYYIYTPDRKRINDMYLLDYFSEGFRAFYLETELLKQKDPKLYDFIARLSDDKK